MDLFERKSVRSKNMEELRQGIIQKELTPIIENNFIKESKRSSIHIFKIIQSKHWN